jgi:hypothetical protein
MWSQIRWFKGASPTGDQYVEVSTTNPLPVTTVGGGAGGAEEVEVTSWTATETVKVEQQGALPAGTNTIGDVGITGALPAGTNTIGKVTVTGTGGDALTTQYGSQSATDIGLIVNARLLAYDGSDANPVLIDTGGHLLVSDVGSSQTIADVLNVTTAGTRVQLPSHGCKEVTIIAKKANTGQIFLGGSNVSSTVYGLLMDAKDSITLKVANSDQLWIDASTNGEGISYFII